MLFGGLSAAEAHDSTTETYEVEVPVYEWVTEPVMATRVVDVFDMVPTEVEVQRTREVGVFDFVPRQVQVQRTREVPVYDHVPQQFQVQRTRVVPVYNFVPQQVQVQRTRVVPVYNEVVETVRVAPFRERVTIQPPCEWVTVYGQRVYYCPSPRTTWRDVYNYRTTTRYVLVGTRTETYTATETQMVWTQTGTRTETYTATETKMVWTQVGTRTETYTATETQMVWTKVGTRTETYTATETQMMRTKTGTRTETYDTGATRLVKQDTGRTRTETRTRTVHTGCPDGYHELDSPDTPAWIEFYTGHVTFSKPFLEYTYNRVNWVGPLDVAHPYCYMVANSSLQESLDVLVVAGREWAVEEGRVIIEGVRFAIENGLVVISDIASVPGVIRETFIDGLEQALIAQEIVGIRGICGNALTVAATSGFLSLILFAVGVSAAPALVMGIIASAWIGVACEAFAAWEADTRPGTTITTTTTTTTTTLPPDETATVPTVRTIPPYDRERFSLRGSSLSAVPGCRLWVYWVYSEPHRLAMHLCERS